METDQQHVVVITIGLNGYQHLYRQPIQSQRTYCRRHGYHHVLINRPAVTAMGRACAWLKIPAILSALEHGWPWVLFLDSDVEARPGAPDIRSLERPGKDVYLALGESRRVNSGVILVRNTSEARALFSKILASATQPVPAEDEVTSWGENGHAIHFTKSYPGLELIGREWNNTAGPMTDHFRHYTGSMKAHFHRSLTGRLSVRFGRVMAKSGVLKEPGPDFHLDVEDLAARAFAPHRDVLACRALYPLPRHRAGTLTQDLGTR